LRPKFDRSGDRSITPHPEARGGTRWNVNVEYSILKRPDRWAPNHVSGVSQAESAANRLTTSAERVFLGKLGMHWR
jgi:hypothetical protein